MCVRAHAHVPPPSKIWRNVLFSRAWWYTSTCAEILSLNIQKTQNVLQNSKLLLKKQNDEKKPLSIFYMTISLEGGVLLLNLFVHYISRHLAQLCVVLLLKIQLLDVMSHWQRAHLRFMPCQQSLLSIAPSWYCIVTLKPCQ